MRTITRDQVIAQGDGIELIGPEGGVVALRSVDDVVQVAALFVPEPLLECRYGSLPISLALIGVRCLAEQAGEGLSDSKACTHKA